MEGKEHHTLNGIADARIQLQAANLFARRCKCTTTTSVREQGIEALAPASISRYAQKEEQIDQKAINGIEIEKKKNG